MTNTYGFSDAPLSQADALNFHRSMLKAHHFIIDEDGNKREVEQLARPIPDLVFEAIHAQVLEEYADVFRALADC